MPPAVVASPADPKPFEGPRRFQQHGRGPVEASGFYVTRSADDELFGLLESGSLCHVLAPRQIGKSSLRFRTQDRLRARHIRCASVDLTGIGGNASPDQWYLSMAQAIAKGLSISDPEALWTKTRRLSPVRRFHEFLDEQVLGDAGPPTVIFIDEIDVTLALPFPRDDFFNVIRATHQARVEDPRWKRLTFCLLGVAAPLDLIENATRTPFNSSVAVRVDDFTWEEAKTFLPGLANAGGDARALLERVFEWTNGHPALTHRLCWMLVDQKTEAHGASTSERIDTLVQELYLKSGRINDPILLEAESRFSGDRPDARIPVMLHLYQRLLAGDAVPADGNNTRQFGLRIAGLAAERMDAQGTWLRVRNLIFETVFGREWIEEKLARRFLTEPLQIWKDAGNSPDHVLRGDALKVALGWAHGRDDVTPDERDFLQASQSGAAAEAEEHRQAEMYRTRAVSERRNARLFAVIAALSLTLAAVAAWNYYQASALGRSAAEALQQNQDGAKKREDDTKRKAQATKDHQLELERQVDEANKAARQAKIDIEQAGLTSDQRKKAAERSDTLAAFAVAMGQRADYAKKEAENATKAESAAREAAEAALRASQTRATSTIQSLQDALVAARKEANKGQTDLATARTELTTTRQELETARGDADRLRSSASTTAAALIQVSAQRDAATQDLARVNRDLAAAQDEIARLKAKPNLP